MTHEDKLAAAGTRDGTIAGKSYFDGNTTREAYARVLKGIQDGDPEIMDELPFADLSGQWAGGETPSSLVRGEIGEEIETYLHKEVVADGDTGHFREWYELDELITYYEDAFSDAASAAIEKICLNQLNDD